MNTESILHKSITNSESPPGDVAPQSRKRWLKMATSAVDRAGDMLVMDGMDATNFKRNPQFLWQHGGSGALINTIGRVLKLAVTPDDQLDFFDPPIPCLWALVEYDTSPLAEQIFEIAERGLLPANSIGFRPLEWHANDFGGNTFTKWELIECSKVELPMNPEAVDSAKSLVLSTESELLPIIVSNEVVPSVEDAAEWLCCR